MLSDHKWKTKWKMNRLGGLGENSQIWEALYFRTRKTSNTLNYNSRMPGVKNVPRFTWAMFIIGLFGNCETVKSDMVVIQIVFISNWLGLCLLSYPGRIKSQARKAK